MTAEDLDAGRWPAAMRGQAQQPATTQSETATPHGATSSAPRASAPGPTAPARSTPPAELPEAELTLANEDHTSMIDLSPAGPGPTSNAGDRAAAGSIFDDLGVTPPPGALADDQADDELDDDAFDPALAPPPGYRTPE